MRKIVFICLLLMLIVKISTAQESEREVNDVLSINIDLAIEMALEQNPLIRISKLGVESSEAQYYETLGNLLPSINASGAYNRNLKRPVIFMPDEAPFFGQVLEIGSEHSYNAGISGRIPIYNHALYSNMKANKIQKHLSEEELRAAKIDLEYNVKMAFYNTLLAKESFEIMDQRFVNAQANLEKIQSMYKQGMVSEFDLIRAEVQTENLKPSLLQSENAYKRSLNYLKVLTGIENSKNVELQGSLVQLSEEVLPEYSLEKPNESIANNTDLVQLDIRTNLIEQQAKAIKASNLPSLTAIGNYQFQSQANDYNFSDYEWVQTSAIGLQLNIPVFNGLTTRNRAKQLLIASKQLSLQKNYLEENLNVQLEDNHRTIALAIEKAANAESNIKLAKKAYNIALKRYNTGQGTLLEVNDSEISLAQAQFNLIQAIHEILAAKTDHEKFLGENK
ncbi:MAG: TolC family protein [Bacteroidota bacterium]